MYKTLFLLLLASAAVSCSNKQELLDDPMQGDIYILEDAGTYYPMKIDSIADGSGELYFVNSKYMFADAIPKKSDLPDNEFDYSLQLIYAQPELQRLYDDGTIVQIYR